MRVRVVVLATVVATLVGSGAAHASPKRVTLVAADDGSDERLISATTATLAPWDIELDTSSVAPPGDQLPAAAEAARGLARSLDVDAVVWLAEGPDGTSVWVYDRRNDNVIARAIAASRPFDPPAAAAVALTIKTLLRHSEAAPPSRRFGSSDARTRRVRLSASGGVRVRPGSDSDTEPRLGIGALWRPPLLGDRLEAYTRVTAGPGTSINDSGFVGRFADTAVSVGVGYHVPIGDRYSVRPAVGGTLEATVLDGVLADAETGTRIRRFNPSLDVSLLGVANLGQIQVGVRLEGSYLFRRQQFLVDGESIFALSSRDIQTALLVTVPLY